MIQDVTRSSGWGFYGAAVYPNKNAWAHRNDLFRGSLRQYGAAILERTPGLQKRLAGRSRDHDLHIHFFCFLKVRCVDPVIGDDAVNLIYGTDHK